jgi:hypothetical protein
MHAAQLDRSAQEVIAAEFGIGIEVATNFVALGAAYEEEMQNLESEARSAAFHTKSNASLERKRVSAVERHRIGVASLIGNEACERVERWLNTDLRPRIQAFKMEKVDRPTKQNDVTRR